MVERQLIPIHGRDDLVVQITDDGSRTLLDVEMGVAFHSASGAVTETKHVYLDNSLVSQRLGEGKTSRVLEIGLGTAMGLLLTLDQAIEHRVALEYNSLELRLLPADVLSQLNLHEHLEHPWLAAAFLDWRRNLGEEVADGQYVWEVDHAMSHSMGRDLTTAGNEGQPDASPIRCTISVGDFSHHAFEDDATYDAIYFDPFAPSASPDLWSGENCSKLRKQLSPGGRLTTYCVSREVREKFCTAGFDVKRVRGPEGGKREVLIAFPRLTVET